MSFRLAPGGPGQSRTVQEPAAAAAAAAAAPGSEGWAARLRARTRSSLSGGGGGGGGGNITFRALQEKHVLMGTATLGHDAKPR